jgi:hypothetical protein
MRKRYGLLAICCGVVLATAGLLWLNREREPVYEGKDLSYWARRWPECYRGSPVLPHVQEALVALGTNRLDLLVRRVSYDPQHDILIKTFDLFPAGNLRARTYSRTLGMILSRRSRQADDAQVALRALGPAAAPVVPQLSKLLDKGAPIPAERALELLPFLGDEGLSAIASRAALTNNPRHFQLIQALAVRTNFPPAFAALTNALSDPDLTVREQAANILSGRVFE